MAGGIEGEGPRGEPTPQKTKPEKAAVQGGSESTGVQPSVFGNCIVGDLMPSSERVGEMLAEGRITEEQAAQQMKEAQAYERVIRLGERISAIRRQFFPIDNGLSTQEKRNLRAEYKSLRKEDRCLRKQLWENT
jgi:hypothetical protein